MKKKLLVILGAGSSASVGLPSVAALDACMKGWSREWATLHNYPDYFAALWEAIDAYYGSAHSGLRPLLSFEKVLGEMVVLAHWMEPAPWGDTLIKTASDGAPPPNLVFPCSLLHSGPQPYGAHIMVMSELDYLLGKLARHMRNATKDLDLSSSAGQQYKMLVEGLREDFEVGIYNLNYDTVALSAWPGAYTGFGEAGSFEPSRVHQRAQWNFVYHLHGSVHHSLQHQFGGPICWREDLSKEKIFFDDLEGRSSDKRSEGRSFPRASLIAGGFKLDQLLVEPFHSLHAALVKHIYEAEAILIGGYGFADVHINRALQNRLTTPHAKPPVIVLDRADNKTDPMSFRHDLWSHELCAALGATGNFFLEPGHSSPAVPSELAATASFEVAHPHRVALWHGGFAEAAKRLDGIIPWLNGAPDEFLKPRT